MMAYTHFCLYGMKKAMRVFRTLIQLKHLMYDVYTNASLITRSVFPDSDIQKYIKRK